MKTFLRRLSTRRRRSTTTGPLAAHVEVLEDRSMLSGSMPLSGIGSQARDVVIQAYETLVGEKPTLAEQNHLLRIEAAAGQNALVPAIVATPAFYYRTAGGDASGYVTLAAATLDQFPTQAKVDRLTREIEILGAKPRVLNQVVLRLNPPGSKSRQPSGRPNPLYKLLKQDVLINADYYSDTPKILGASLGF